MSIIDDIKARYKTGGIIIQLIMVNLAVFIVFGLLDTFQKLLGTPASFSGIALLSVPASVQMLLYKPWTLFTYMFTHFQFLHILFNMLMLYWFGPLFLQLFDKKQLFGLYIIGGLAGALFYIGAFNLFPYFENQLAGSTMVGASASIMAIVVASAMRAPEMELNLLFIGKVKLKYIALFYVLIDVLNTTSDNSGGHFAHLGGAFAGFLFVYLLRSSSFDLSAWVSGISDAIQGVFSSRGKRKMKVKWKRPVTDMQYRNERAATQGEIDSILEKIKRSGYASLSAKEKQKLFEASNK